MITFVASLINFVALTIQNLLFVASFVGRVIVTVLTTTSSILFTILEYVITFLQIVYEDNISTFSEDLPNFTNNVMDSVVDQWVFLQELFYKVTNKLYDNVIIAIGSIKWTINLMYIIVSEVFILLKEVVILLGDTLWFILTFIPLQLIHMLKAVSIYAFDSVLNAITNAYMTLLKFTNFLTDVPLESFIGITITMIIVRLCIYFGDNIQSQLSAAYWSLIRKCLYLYYLVYNYFTDSEVRVITQITGQERVISNTTVNVIDEASDADALCVVCQERQKCVLTLPCRHVCLCTECCMRLYGYQRTCPICRTFIYHSVIVYL